MTSFDEYLKEATAPGHTVLKKHIMSLGDHTHHSSEGSHHSWFNGKFDAAKIHTHMKKIDPQAKIHEDSHPDHHEVSGNHNGVKYTISRNDEGHTFLHTAKTKISKSKMTQGIDH